MLIDPAVRGKITPQVVLINGAMPGAATAAGHHLDLRASRSVEICCLIGDVNFEFLDAFNWCWHYASYSASSIRGLGGEATGVGIHGAVHVVGVITTIELKRVLIAHSAGNGSVRGRRGCSVRSDDTSRLRFGNSCNCCAAMVVPTVAFMVCRVAPEAS